MWISPSDAPWCRLVPLSSSRLGGVYRPSASQFILSDFRQLHEGLLQPDLEIPIAMD